MFLTLVGPRGAGKSSLGAALAERLGLSFADLDRIIELEAGESIPEIFARAGEASFRALERAAFCDWHGQEGWVLATGGGAILHPETRAELAASGRCALLWAAPAVLAERIRGSDRPSLTGRAVAEEIEQIWLAREPLYRAAASHSVDTTTLSPEEALHVLEQLWQDLSGHELR